MTTHMASIHYLGPHYSKGQISNQNNFRRHKGMELNSKQSKHTGTLLLPAAQSFWLPSQEKALFVYYGLVLLISNNLSSKEGNDLRACGLPRTNTASHSVILSRCFVSICFYNCFLRSDLN